MSGYVRISFLLHERDASRQGSSAKAAPRHQEPVERAQEPQTDRPGIKKEKTFFNQIDKRQNLIFLLR
jgi:hypothetical protein